MNSKSPHLHINYALLLLLQVLSDDVSVAGYIFSQVGFGTLANHAVAELLLMFA